MGLLARAGAADPRVVDEDVERRELGGERADVVEAGEVGAVEGRRTRGLQRRFALLVVAAVEQDGVAGLDQFAREGAAEAVGRARDEDGGHAPRVRSAA